jgi:hypothetical protein
MGRRSVHAAALLFVTAALAAGLGSVQAAHAAMLGHGGNGEPVTKKFGYTGGVQTMDLPAGVKTVEITAIGAAGGRGSKGYNFSGGAGGAGTKVRARIPLNGAPLTLRILVGGAGRTAAPSGPATVAGMAAEAALVPAVRVAAAEHPRSASAMTLSPGSPPPPAAAGAGPQARLAPVVAAARSATA